METPTNKTLAGILAFAPLVAVMLYMVFFFGFIFAMEDQMNSTTQMPDGLLGFLASLALLMLVTFVSMVYFVVHSVRNPRLNSDNRIIWLLVNLFAGAIGHILYFFMVINEEGKGNDGSSMF